MRSQAAVAVANAALAAALGVALGVACSRREPPASRQDGQAPADSAAASVGPGDRVVVEFAQADFFEGIATHAAKARVHVEVPDGGGSREVDAVNVYPVAKSGFGRTARAGDFAICEVRPHAWDGCRVEGSQPDGIRVVLEDGVSAVVSPQGLLRPTSVTELNVRQSFEAASRRKVFLEGVQRAGRPRGPKGWVPKPGDNVLVRSAGAYLGGRVRKVKKEQVFVVVDGEGSDPRPFARDEVAPQPPVVFTPSSASYACVRPAAGARAWPSVRIEGVSEGKVIVSDEHGARRTVETRDLVPYQN
jgi:hypothetical protein